MSEKPPERSYAPHADVNLDAVHETDRPCLAFFGDNLGELPSFAAGGMAIAHIKFPGERPFAQLALAPPPGVPQVAVHAAMSADKCRRVAAALMAIADLLDDGRGKQ